MRNGKAQRRGGCGRGRGLDADHRAFFGVSFDHRAGVPLPTSSRVAIQVPAKFDDGNAFTLRHFADAQIFAAMNQLLGVPGDSAPVEVPYPAQAGVAPPRWHAASR